MYKLLLIKKRDNDGDVSYILPGGKQEFGETIEQAVCREVFEEVGITVSSMQSDNDIPLIPPNPDPDQIGTEWIIINELVNLRFNPMQLVLQLIEIASGNKPSPYYVGDIN